MSCIRSKGNLSTEWKVRSALMRAGVRGWSLHAPELPGRPDFAFPAQQVAVFLDGCFWHGCHKCGRTPSTNTEFWIAKITRNKTRDKRVTRALRNRGWRVLRFWEHQLASPERVVRRIQTRLER